MREQIRDPHRVIHVGLPARDVLDMRGVREDEIERLLEDVPDWLPVDTRRLHRDVRDLVFGQPIRQGQQRRSRRSERSHIVRRRSLGCDSNAGHNGVLVDIEPRATGMKNFHNTLLLAWRGALEIEI
jgi:hypothetical protein